MIFGQGDAIVELSEKIDSIKPMLDNITPERIDALSGIAEFSNSDIEKLDGLLNNMIKYRTDIETVRNGLDSIKNVLGIQNQVQYVSDIRDSIGLVAGNIEDVKAVAEYKHVMGASVAMKPMVDEMLAMSVKMDAVLDMEEDIKEFLLASVRMSVILKDMNQVRNDIQRDLETSANMMNKVSMVEKRIDEKLKRIEEVEENMQSFNVSVEHVGSDIAASHSFSRESNTLNLVVPKGETGEKGNHKGDKGKPGDNGSNFKPSYMGGIIDRARYNAYPVGVSYLSLDEIPTMIYFRKSNAINDWTEGQPFGVSNGGYSDENKGIDIVDGINIDELTTHILRNMKGRQDGNIST